MRSDPRESIARLPVAIDPPCRSARLAYESIRLGADLAPIDCNRQSLADGNRLALCHAATAANRDQSQHTRALPDGFPMPFARSVSPDRPRGPTVEVRFDPNDELHAFLDFLNKSVVGSLFTQFKSPAFVNLDWTPTFTPYLLRKDLDLGALLELEAKAAWLELRPGRKRIDDGLSSKSDAPVLGLLQTFGKLLRFGLRIA
jgi:hypothetical protein